MRNQRKKIWIDSFQTFLSLRLAVCFSLYQFAIWALYAIDAIVLSATVTVPITAA